MITYPIFWKKFITRRIGDLTSIQSLQDIGELPNQSILHILDNFNATDEFLVVPNVDSLLFKFVPERKILAHNLTFKSRDSDIYTNADDLIKPAIGSIVQKLQHFRSIHNRTIRFVPALEQLIPRNAYQAMINHNNLFRVRVMGINRKDRLFRYVIGSVLNTIMLFPEYKHFVPIELTDAVFSKASFQRAFKNITRVTLKHPNSMHYIFLAHFLSFIHSNSNTSIFEIIPEHLLENIVFMLIHGDSVVFYELKTLKEMNGTENSIMLRLIANCNMVASNGTISGEIVEDRGSSDLGEDEAPEPTDEDAASSAKDTTTTTKDDSDLDTKEIPSKVEEPDIIKPKLSPITQKNIPIYEKPELDDAQAKVLLEQDKTQLEEEGKSRISEIHDPTKAKIERVKKLSQAYKTIKLTPDGKSFDELLTVPTPTEVSEHKIEVLGDQIPDPSMLSSKIVRFSQDYMDQLFEADLARTLTAFNKHGMFLTGVESKEEINKLSRIRHYVAKYEDVNHQTHTIRFSFPIVDRYGNCMLNGVHKYFKKQRVNNPIVKSGPGRVSISSNYNKILVERVGSVANSFQPYICKLLVKMGAEIVYGAAQEPHNWIWLELPELEKFDYELWYKQKIPVSVPVVGEQLYRWTGKNICYASTKLGPVRIKNIKNIDSLKEYSKYGNLTKRDVESLGGDAAKVIEIEFLGVDVPQALPYEFTTAGQRVKHVKYNELSFRFHYAHRFEDIGDSNLVDSILEDEKQYGVYVGTVSGSEACYIDLQGVMTIVDLNNENPIRRTTLIDILLETSGIDMPRFNEYVVMKILNNVLPVGFVLCYRFGLKYILDYLKVKYHVIRDKSEERELDIPESSVVIKFKDAKLIVPRTPGVPAMILGGLNSYNLKDYHIDEMDARDVYHMLMEQKKMSINYLKGVDSFFDLFLDPITIDVLRQMGEPTNALDLIIRAVALLLTEDYEPAGSTKNSRIRSYERMNGILYNEVARTFATHKYRSLGAKGKVSINPFVVLNRISTDSLMENVNTINPIHDIKMQSTLSHLGDGGRSDQTFMINDRRFTPDSIGVISEATVDSGNVAIIVGTSANPVINNLRGQSAGIDPDKIEPAQLLSPSSLLMPGVTNDDSSRVPSGRNTRMEFSLIAGTPLELTTLQRRR